MSELPDTLKVSTLTEYQKGGLDFRAWVRFEIAHMQSENAAPGNRLETDEERGMQKAFELVKAHIGELLLEPLPNPLAVAAREIAEGQLSESPLSVTKHEDFPFA